MKSLLIFGAGTHGKVVADAAILSGKWERIVFADDKYPSLDTNLGCPVVANLEDARRMSSSYPDAVVALGNNDDRLSLTSELAELGFSLPPVMHPRATVASTAVIAGGVVVFANSVIQPDSNIGFAAIVNTAASVDHDCRISEGVHIGPGVHLAGGISIGACTWVGIGSSVIQNLRIGHHVTIGAGSCVIDDVEDNSIVMGVPAKSAGKRSGN